ncbi:MAG: hypothetical protein A3C27_03225 [Candidatus Levybacteria bacterium RIFCSPHIGHO2_02_FULL_39_36]|nr:MAG: hypothetical protein A3C27_03225 [Candidatus Levybacteria bacterium RIFCSPHIGHO2_02_FULL_39_36]OGH48347.1 MAG: hypothetical protein A3G66_01640 [Candidatus Levybacteria bacterium RIFCSPLOWO2_12_FULL_39_17]
MKRKKIFFVTLFLVVFLIFFIIKNLFILDPDFGWHLRLGELILKSGIPKTDPFSYTMPSFPFVDHEWLSNIMIYFIYQKSFILLAIVFALFPLFTLLITFYKNFKPFLFGVYILSFSVLLSFSGIRIQTISWMLVSTLLVVVLNGELWKRFRFFIPLLILLWANLHGGFAIAIYILALTIAAKAIERKIERLDFVVFFASLFATFLNPYGPRLWGEIFLQIGDPSLRWKIAEWLPGVFFIELSFILLLAISLVLVFRFRSKLSILDLTIFLGLILLSFSSARHIPFLIIANLCLAQKTISIFYSELRGKKVQEKRFLKVAFVFAVLSLFIFSYEHYSLNLGSNSRDKYPSAAVSYLKKERIKGEIFSDYGWGGYLIWKMPEKKVFIDGRMPSWRWNAPSSESDYAFHDFSEISKGDYKKYFEKYNIRYVLWPRDETKDPRLFSINISFFKKENRPSLIERLEQDSWEKVYEDQAAVIYRK